jgi:enoyl-CoA hydratase/carnithine racemase
MSNDVVRHTLEEGVLDVVLDRPPANALGAPIVEGLEAAFAGLGGGDVRVVVVRSEVPGFFAAGADIKQMGSLDAASFTAYRDALRGPIERLAASGVPSVAAIDGLALGGGLELALACSLRFATPASRFGLPEVKLGLIPGAGGTQRLPRVVGRGLALDLMLSGRDIDGPEALRVGLVERLVDGDVSEEALAFARTLARSSVPAVRSIIACVEAAGGPFDAGMTFEGDEVIRMVTEGEAREGIAAFIEKRRPVFD